MRHEGLTKAQSSLLSQARIGDIGLRDYLFRVKSPGGPVPPIASAGEAGRRWSTWWFGAPTRRYKGRGTAERFGHIGTYKPVLRGSFGPKLSKPALIESSREALSNHATCTDTQPAARPQWAWKE
ncbi:predicted protein [Chaetomium globosum CBS 148.51]|uniref:Uncharacterized protein n=1 Tax=Chaetomium globosum (strain ATCC 6205 / CBS 148.51 / DSM 1962 / NBRC 6347 / NRRL 1970) TaxID=306901 RepID=Q2GUQ6_CHAGB|nr:uncharacterized protein CHGG_08298 [Chaetomium globosum CBS 148.51]EAQ87045.1 predicted protein [Chaetomium globosum CBS 148.51]